MHKLVAGILTLVLFGLSSGLSWAQTDGYTIQRPGQLPTYVNPNYGGGYTIQTPGQLPSYATPNYGGGYTTQTPGQLPTYTTPNYGGGYTIQTPGNFQAMRRQTTVAAIRSKLPGSCPRM